MSDQLAPFLAAVSSSDPLVGAENAQSPPLVDAAHPQNNVAPQNTAPRQKKHVCFRINKETFFEPTAPLVTVTLDAENQLACVENSKYLCKDSAQTLLSDVVWLSHVTSAWGNTLPATYIELPGHGMCPVASGLSFQRSPVQASAAFECPKGDRVVFVETLDEAEQPEQGGVRIVLQFCGIERQPLSEQTIAFITFGNAFESMNSDAFNPSVWQPLNLSPTYRPCFVKSTDSVVPLPCQRIRLYAHVWGNSGALKKTLVQVSFLSALYFGYIRP